jgi:hypothetical protein
MTITVTSLALLLRMTIGAVLPDDLSDAIVTAASGSCARLASIVTVCYRESNLGQSPRARILCGAMNVRLPAEPGEPRRLDRSYSAQIGEVVRVFGATTDRDVLARRFADWRCGGHAPRCVATTGAAYAATSMPIWNRVYARCRLR